MNITVKSSKEVWASPDGQRNIWEIQTPEGTTWQTMSRQIAQAIGQTLDLTTRVSAAGKTYLVKPPQEQQVPPAYQGAQAAVDAIKAPPAPTITPELLERLIRVLQGLDDHLRAVHGVAANTDLPPLPTYEGPEEVLDDL
jgi:hypothetical protein